MAPDDNKKDRLVLAVDLDGTLCDGVWWGFGPHPQPLWDRVEKINKLYGKHVIFIHTARRESMRADTEAWLKKAGIKYHALVMDKVGADLYIDDKGITDARFFTDVWTKLT